MPARDRLVEANGAQLYLLAEDMRQFRKELGVRAGSEGEGPSPFNDQLTKWIALVESMPLHTEFLRSGGRGHGAFRAFAQDSPAAGRGPARGRGFALLLVQILVLGGIFLAALGLMGLVVFEYRAALGEAIVALVEATRASVIEGNDAGFQHFANSPSAALGLALLGMCAAYLVAWFAMAARQVRRRAATSGAIGAIIVLLSAVLLGLAARGLA